MTEKNIKDICFVVNSRLGSTRVKRKMIRPFGGSSLFEIAIRKIPQSSVIPPEQFFVSVWEDELKEIAKRVGVNIFHRSEQSAKNETSLREIFEWCDKLDFKYVVVVNPCLPFMPIETIDRFVTEFLTSEHQGLFGVIRTKDYFWNKNHEMITPLGKDRCLNTKLVEECFKVGHCLYASTMEGIRTNNYMGDYTKNNPALFELEPEQCIDIDYQWEFDMANAYYKYLHGNDGDENRQE